MKQGFFKRKMLTALLCLAGMALVSHSTLAQTTRRISVNSNGEQGNYYCEVSSISGDGRYILFTSLASNLSPYDTNSSSDVFVHDRVMGTTECVSISSITGETGNSSSNQCVISADGRYAVYQSSANDLVSGDSNNSRDIFAHDQVTGGIERVSVSSTGAQANSLSYLPSVSGDGQYVAFGSSATNLTDGDTNGTADIFVRDRVAGTTRRISVSSGGEQANGGCDEVSISADGRYIAFVSDATNLVPNDTNGRIDAFVHDQATGATERVSVSSTGEQANDDSNRIGISADGRYVVFLSWAYNLGNDLQFHNPRVYLRDRALGTTEYIGGPYEGVETLTTYSIFRNPISADGRYVVFSSYAPNIVPGDTNNTSDVYVHDRQTGVIWRASVGAGGRQLSQGSSGPAISADGQYVSFNSSATDLVPDDTNGWSDVFVRGPLNATELATISGKVTFPDLTPTAFPVTVMLDFRTTDGRANYVRTFSVGQGGDFVINDVPRREYQLHLNAPRHIAVNVPVQASEGSADNVAATLLSGDANSDNFIDVLDLDQLIQAFDATPSSPNWNPFADFNGDNGVDVLDLDILLRNFDTEGDA